VRSRDRKVDKDKANGLGEGCERHELCLGASDSQSEGVVVVCGGICAKHRKSV